MKLVLILKQGRRYRALCRNTIYSNLAIKNLGVRLIGRYRRLYTIGIALTLLLMLLLLIVYYMSIKQTYYVVGLVGNYDK